MSNCTLETTALTKAYQQGEDRIAVLSDVNLCLHESERLTIVGRSGSGKSTLLHLLAGLDTPDSGSVVLAGHELSTASNNQRALLRCQYLGFVYQNHHLLGEFSALENVAMPLRIAGVSSDKATKQASELLHSVGLEHRAKHGPAALSGGERQRVAVARAIAGQPAVVLADEPTGNLDTENAHQVMELLRDLSKQYGTAFIVVTHDLSMLSDYDRVLTLVDGHLQHNQATG